jgi:hypothetical protein
MTRKRKPTYPTPAPKRRGPTDGGAPIPRTSIAMDTTAGLGRAGLSVGQHVRITGAGLHAGETGVIERFTGSVVPTAVVRTGTGGTKHIRTIDLEPAPRA